MINKNAFQYHASYRLLQWPSLPSGRGGVQWGIQGEVDIPLDPDVDTSQTQRQTPSLHPEADTPQDPEADTTPCE